MPVDINKIALRGTTQEHLDIEDIRENLVILKNGSCALIIQASAVNFSLLSETEQDAIIYTYAGLINSLTFPIQIVIRSKHKDVSNYVSQLVEAENRQTNPLLKNQIAKYREFVVKTVRENNVLDKKFYVIIPYSFLELGTSGATKSVVNRGNALPIPKEEILEKAKIALTPKAEHLLRLLGSIGLKSRQLTTPELIELFFDVYNPNTDRPNLSEITSYTTPVVLSKSKINEPVTKPPEPVADPENHEHPV